jgi:hypothetical protein
MKGLCGLWLVCLIWCVTPAGAGVVKNGSFEMDGPISYVTADTRPRYWCDVTYNDSIFSAYVGSDWKTDGQYSLTMFTSMFVVFQQNGAATISQPVYLNGVEQIIFDIRLLAVGNFWDPNIITSRVLIDGNEVWDSNGLTFSGGQFVGEIAIDVNEIYKDGNNHILSLELRTNIVITSYTQYVAQWDNVRLYSGCTLPGDFTGDCVVDINDLAVFAKGWLQDGSHFNFADFAIFADFWGTSDNSSTTQPPQDNLLDADLNDDGIVDYADILLFSESWLGDGGPCVRADLNNDGIVNFFDFVTIAESWQQTGSLYGW